MTSIAFILSSIKIAVLISLIIPILRQCRGEDLDAHTECAQKLHRNLPTSLDNSSSFPEASDRLPAIALEKIL